MIFIVFLFTISFGLKLASAEEYPINQPIEFNKPCVDQANNYCPVTTQCYVSLKYKNGATILSNKTMTYIYPYANYTFPAQSELRDYIATVNCYNAGQNGTQDYQFKVNVTGDDRDNYSLLLILGVAAILVFAFGYFTHNVWFIYISGIMFLVLGTYDLIYGFNNFRDTYTDVIGYVSIVFGIFFFVMGAYEQFVSDDAEDE
jgi:hypothetical protein